MTINLAKGMHYMYCMVGRGVQDHPESEFLLASCAVLKKEGEGGELSSPLTWRTRLQLIFMKFVFLSFLLFLLFLPAEVLNFLGSPPLHLFMDLINRRQQF